MQSFTFGSDEGFEAVHEAMLHYLTARPDFCREPRNVYHTSWNLTDMTQLLNMLEFVMMYGHSVQANAIESPAEKQQIQELIEWAEDMHRSIATTVDVELI